jgi:protein-S-isoprenylcysteine O-methyltransferase Ste14
MENEFTFRIILLVLLTAFIVHRGYYTKKHNYSDENTLKKRDEGLASKVSSLLGMVGFISTILFLVNPNWLGWASFPLSPSLRWSGVGIAIAGFVLLQWAQNALGKNWSDTPRMMKSQALVTSGPYRRIRHPIYTAFLLILGATFFISANWLIGLSFIGMTSLEIASRIGFEESLMIQYFGNEYQEYMKRTGRILPKLIE